MSETSRELVGRLVAAGEWPEPGLLGEIAAQGNAAVEPLLEVVRREVHGWPEEAPLYHAVHLLGTLGAKTAIPDLVELFRRYDNETAESAAEVLGYLGAGVVEPALAVAREESLRWYSRSSALSAAQRAAGQDPDLRARVAATVRELLARQLALARELRAEAGASGEAPGGASPDTEERHDDEALEEHGDQDELDDEPDAEEDELEDGADWDDDDFEGDEEPDGGREADLYQMTTTLVLDLTHLADPEGLPLIRAAYDAGIVDEWMIRREDVEECYREGGMEPAGEDPRAWLDRYREDYRRHVAEERRKQMEAARAAPRLRIPPPPPAAGAAPADSLRNLGRKIGRNDPCWCGSGKKYKNCHLRPDRE